MKCDSDLPRCLYSFIMIAIWLWAHGLCMKLRKSLLRECARVALEQRGLTVELISGAGIVQGARLRARKDYDDERDIAVRTSLDREVGLTRNPDGHWATIPRMDEVIVVVPAADDPDSAEVFSFAPDAIVQAFDAVLKARQKEHPDFSPKAPIFLALDEASSGRSADVVSGLKTKAQWRTLVPLASVPRYRLSQTASAVGFIERVRQEFADLHGVDVNKVTVEFRITS